MREGSVKVGKREGVVVLSSCETRSRTGVLPLPVSETERGWDRP